MKSNKHIVIFTPGFPVDEEDGSCIPPLQNYVRALASKEGYDVTVLSLHYPFKQKKYNWHGINVHALGGANVGYPGRFLVWRKAHRVLKQIHAWRSIDIIHSFWMHECGLLGNSFSRKKGIPHLITLMGQDLKPPNRFVKFIDQSYPTLVALSDFQPYREEAGVREVDATIPFGLPGSEIDWVKPSSRDIDVIGIGSLIKLKNYTLFLRVISNLIQHKPDLKAVIIGDGVDRKDVETTINHLGLQNNITLLGQLIREQVYDHLSRSRVFLHTSSYETQGYVFNEALMAGVPIVSTQVGIAHEMPYWKVRAHDVEMAEAVMDLLNHPVEVPEKAHGDIRDTVASYSELYERSLISSATSAPRNK